MTTTATPTKNPRTLIAAGTSNAAGATTRGTLDLRNTFGGLLTIKITNGGTGPTVQAVANVLCAHNSGATPAAASAGADWKTLYQVGNGTTSGTVGEWSIPVDQAVMHLEVEITGNTGQAVSCEAYFSEMSNVVYA
ncbi:MAG: hypothetical protein PHU46_12205 [Rhodocyclaceae bacterium]|nr:hypothetical protein [Rhodocyclaceae bacterium]